MDYGSIPGIDKPVSRLVQGTVMIGGWNDEYEKKLLDDVLAAGINTFDTAHIYAGGDNERAFGRWVNERGVREKVVVIGKGAHHNGDRRRVTPWDITADLYDSLARFKFDYIDLYLLHRDDPDYPVEEIVDILNEHKKAGRIRAFGGSNWTAERLQAANDYAASKGLAPFVASSPHFSLAIQHKIPWDGCVTITGDANADARKWYQEAGMPVFSWSSVAGGLFTGRYTRENCTGQTEGHDGMVIQCYAYEDNFQRVERAEKLAAEKGVTASQIALAWVLQQPMDVYPLIGARSTAEVEDNLKALTLKLTEQELDWLLNG